MPLSLVAIFTLVVVLLSDVTEKVPQVAERSENLGYYPHLSRTPVYFSNPPFPIDPQSNFIVHRTYKAEEFIVEVDGDSLIVCLMKEEGNNRPHAIVSPGIILKYKYARNDRSHVVSQVRKLTAEEKKRFIPEIQRIVAMSYPDYQDKPINFW